jgi:RNA polymerase sigma-70 factor (ECF subfamily)
MNRIDRASYSEIASALCISVKAVEKRMSGAIEILKQKIEIKI